jgi:hypothetical protein
MDGPLENFTAGEVNQRFRSQEQPGDPCSITFRALDCKAGVL